LNLRYNSELLALRGDVERIRELVEEKYRSS